MDNFGFLTTFTLTVRSLYENTNTKVVINGHLSSENSSLKGYSNIPGIKGKLIASLFADDTTVFLAEDDELEDLEGVLNKWCKASTVVFNVAKIQILPIWEKDQIPKYIHIAVEDEAIRILGAWYGHKLHDRIAWTSQLEKINCSMDRRKTIIQMVIGGMTQYLTSTEKKLQKRIRQFLCISKT
ncbi:hypothetical protein BT96DRAFT_1051503 [Gymnopus androsaceus JB14]|uniref:Reverse transcriptase domain-containing protein n=1 Tax=Gymnopus androsaceus JB14 TaxID=1447944 RepID=A0A6A4H6R8_9AGAR|nr:hypothetical protein BT96DRAFT_1051503 [Gymnopus androsaceus JB14]